MVIGRVDWFGGLNKKTGQINNFGFITPVGLGEDRAEGVYVARQDVTSELQPLLKPGIYVQFEIDTDRKGRKRAINVKLTDDLGIVSHSYKGICSITASEGKLYVTQIDSENLHKGDIVFFNLKYNKDTNENEPILVKKIHISPENNTRVLGKLANSSNQDISKQFVVKYANTLPLDEAITFVIEKIATFSDTDKETILSSLITDADGLLLASSELRQLLVSVASSNQYANSLIYAYCQFIKKYVHSAFTPVNQELWDEFLAVLAQSNDLLRSTYWSQVDFLKENFSYKCQLWNLAPKELQTSLIKKRFQQFFEIVSQFEESEYPFAQSLSADWKGLYDSYNVDDLDRRLVQKWCSGLPRDSQSFSLAKMISARGAEHLARTFYRTLGYSVEDTSIHQVTHESDTWLKGDVLLDSKILLDIKNARTSVNSKTYSEFCVPAFKHNRGNDVWITAVLSPYLQLKFMLGEASPIFFAVTNPLILGEFHRSQLTRLEQRFADRFLLLDLSRDSDSRTYLPPWLFDYRDRFYVQQRKIISKFSQIQDIDIPDWEDIITTEIRPLPLFISARRRLPYQWIIHLHQWQIDFISYLMNMPVSSISLPDLFLSILKHFLRMLSNDDTSYSPQQYQEILYVNPHNDHPLKIYDPLNLINDFCDTLQTLWQQREKAKLAEFKIFKFNGNGLLQAKKYPDEPFVTLLAYCGGKVDKKGKCGYRPLVIGKHHNCSTCGRLICPKENCQHCSDYCPDHKARKQIK